MTHINNSLLHAYLDDELSPEQIGSIDNHLSSCPECRLELTRLKRLKSALSGLTSPQPDRQYFQQLQNRIAARTIEQDNSLVPETNHATVTLSGSQNFLRTLIRLAAIITLLFASFYAAQIIQQIQGDKWAESSTERGLAQEDSIQTRNATMEYSPGINRVGSPAPVDAPADSNNDN